MKSRPIFLTRALDLLEFLFCPSFIDLFVVVSLSFILSLLLLFSSLLVPFSIFPFFLSLALYFSLSSSLQRSSFCFLIYYPTLFSFNPFSFSFFSLLCLILFTSSLSLCLWSSHASLFYFFLSEPSSKTSSWMLTLKVDATAEVATTSTTMPT